LKNSQSLEKTQSVFKKIKNPNLENTGDKSIYSMNERESNGSNISKTDLMATLSKI
jgi:hypothetical protein